jgi:hypothetical protein
MVALKAVMRRHPLGVIEAVKFLPEQQDLPTEWSVSQERPSYLNAAVEAAGMPRLVNVFYSYAHRDERLRGELDKHLSPLRRDRIAVWHDRQITPGSDFSNEIDRHLATSDIVLLLISPDFLASDYCYCREMKCAIQRHLIGRARVIPVIIRPCDWHSTPFSRLLALPKDGKPVTTWHRRDEAWLYVAKGVRRAVEELSTRTEPLPRLEVK